MFINVGGIMLTNKHMKKAEVTLEEILFIALSIVVLVLILNLFGGNLQKLVQNSNMGRVWNKNNATAYQKMDTDPTKTQANIQIVADQAEYLTQVHNNAAAAINNYIREQNESGGAALDDDQISNLALQLTIFAESGPTGQPSPQSLLYQTPNQYPSLSYYKFASDNGIYIESAPTIGRTKITRNGRESYVYWGNTKKTNGKLYNEYARYNYSGTTNPDDRIKNIDGIKKCFQEQYKI